MVLPLNVGELTIAQYQRLNLIIDKEDDSIVAGKEIVSFLTGEDEKDNYKLKEAFKTISLMLLKTPDKAINEEIQVRGNKYRAITNAEKISSAQYIDLKTLSENWIQNFHLITAILYQPLVLGVPKKYDGGKLEELSKEMLQVKMKEVFGLFFFYSSVLRKSNPIIQTSLSRATLTIEKQLTEIQNDSEFLQSVGVGDI
jgi:hypothetical protein